MSGFPEPRPLRILHLPDLVGGHPTALANGERALGNDSQLLSYSVSPFGYEADIELQQHDSGVVARWAERFFTFLSVRNQFDVFHFNFGRSLLTSNSGRILLADVPLYPRSAVKVMTFQGSDARLGYDEMLEVSIETEADLGHSIANFRDKRELAYRQNIRRKTIEKGARHCDRFFALNPDLLEFLPKEMTAFMPYAIDAPLVIGPPQVDIDSRPDRPLHFVHLSTNRVLKGTGLIEKVLQRASDELGITYEIVFRQPRWIAMEKLQKADVFIDQMVLGWYGAAAVEAMYLNKPVITYISERQSELAPQKLNSELPVFRASHIQLFETIHRIVKNREQLLKAAKSGKIFAETWHMPKKVAVSSLAIYRDLGKSGGKFLSASS